MKEITTKSVGAVILSPDTKRVLIIFQREGEYWVFPKGKVDPGETELQTLRREMKEEVSLVDFDILPRFREPIFFDFKLNDKTIVHRIVVYYLLKAHTADITIHPEEIIKYKWIPFDTVSKYFKYENQMELLDKVKKYIHV